jgi:hypothetical protein
LLDFHDWIRVRHIVEVGAQPRAREPRDSLTADDSDTRKLSRADDCFAGNADRRPSPLADMVASPTLSGRAAN